MCAFVTNWCKILSLCSSGIVNKIWSVYSVDTVLMYPLHGSINFPATEPGRGLHSTPPPISSLLACAGGCRLCVGKHCGIDPMHANHIPSGNSNYILSYRFPTVTTSVRMI